MKKLLVLFFTVILLAGCQAGAPESSNNQNPPDDNPPVSENKEPTNETVNENNPPTEEQDDLVEEKNFQIKIVDESYKDASLAAFVKDLKKVINEKDQEKLLSMMSDDIFFSFGHDPGKEGFIQYWSLNKNAQDSLIWAEMDKIIKLGGDFRPEDQTIYVIPYLFVHFPESYDPFTHGAVIGEKVNMREQPNTKSKVISQLSYEVVKMTDPPTEEKMMIDGIAYHWQPVTTVRGEKGYIVDKYIYSPLGYRISIQKLNEEWKIISFVAGD